MILTRTNAHEVLAALQEPFPEDAIEWRIGTVNMRDGAVSSALAFAYITRTAAQNRLDAVVGPENWRCEYKEWPDGQLCGISIRIDDEWITKWDGAS